MLGDIALVEGPGPPALGVEPARIVAPQESPVVEIPKRSLVMVDGFDQRIGPRRSPYAGPFALVIHGT